MSGKLLFIEVKGPLPISASAYAIYENDRYVLRNEHDGNYVGALPKSTRALPNNSVIYENDYLKIRS